MLRLSARTIIMRRFLGSSPLLSFSRLLSTSSLSISEAASSVPFNLIIVPEDGSFQPTVGRPTTLGWTNPSNGTIVIYLASQYSRTNVTGHFPASDLQATFTIPPSYLAWTYWFDIQNDEDLNQDSLSTSFNIASSDTPANSQASATQYLSSSTNTSAVTQTSSTGAITIIAVCSAASVLLLCLAAALLFRHVRKRNQNFKSASLSETRQSWPKNQLSPLDKYELQASSIAKQNHGRSELPSECIEKDILAIRAKSGIHELPGYI
jgi:hypothetical protein